MSTSSSAIESIAESIDLDMYDFYAFLTSGVVMLVIIFVINPQAINIVSDIGIVLQIALLLIAYVLGYAVLGLALTAEQLLFRVQLLFRTLGSNDVPDGARKHDVFAENYFERHVDADSSVVRDAFELAQEILDFNNKTDTNGDEENAGDIINSLLEHVPASYAPKGGSVTDYIFIQDNWRLKSDNREKDTSSSSTNANGESVGYKYLPAFYAMERYLLTRPENVDYEKHVALSLLFLNVSFIFSSTSIFFLWIVFVNAVGPPYPSLIAGSVVTQTYGFEIIGSLIVAGGFLMGAFAAYKARYRELGTSVWELCKGFCIVADGDETIEGYESEIGLVNGPSPKYYSPMSDTEIGDLSDQDGNSDTDAIEPD